MSSRPDLPDVYAAGEIALAAGVRVEDVHQLVTVGTIQPIHGRFFTAADAVLAVRSLRLATTAERALFRPAPGLERQRGVPLALSGTLHAAMAAGLVLLTTLGMAKPAALVTPE